MTQAGRAAILARVELPLTSADPVTLHIDRFALRFAVVNRDSVARLSDYWDRHGIYFLLGEGSERGCFQVYVGQAATRPLRLRIQEHVRLNAWPWNRVALVTRDTENGLHSAAVGWLEGRMYDQLQRAPAAQVLGTRPSDETLPQADRDELEHFIPPITAVLRAIGAPPDTPDQEPSPPPPGPRRRVTLTDLLDAGLLGPGDRLRGQRGTEEVFATVTRSGQLRIDDEDFATPSGAAAHFLGHQAAGWDFWKVASGSGEQRPLAALRNALLTQPTNEQ